MSATLEHVNELFANAARLAGVANYAPGDVSGTSLEMSEIRPAMEALCVTSVWHDITAVPQIGELGRDHFQDPFAAKAYDALISVVRKYGRCSEMLVGEMLRERKQFDVFVRLQDGSPGFVGANDVPTAVEFLKQMEPRRKGLLALQTIEKILRDPTLHPEQMREMIAQEINKAFAGADRRQAEHIRDLMAQHGNFLVDREHEQKLLAADPDAPALPAMLGIPTRIPALDKATGGGPTPGQVILIGGFTSMGKSVFAMGLGLEMAAPDTLVYYWTGEMPKEQMARRVTARLQGTKILSVRGLDCFAASEMAPNFWVDDDEDMTIDKLAGKLETFKLSHPALRVLVIDYVTLLCDNDPKEVARVSKKMVKIAKRLRLVVYAVVQLKHEIRSRQDKRPGMGDAAESGQLERDCGGAWYLHRPGYWDNNYEDQTEARLFIVKSRDGRTGHVKLSWNPDLAIYTPLILPAQKPKNEQLQLATPAPEVTYYKDENGETYGLPKDMIP